MFRKTTTLRKWGSSLGIRLPKDMLKEALFVENESVELIADETGIKIQKAKRIEILDDLFKGYSGSYTYHETNTGELLGNEV